MCVYIYIYSYSYFYTSICKYITYFVVSTHMFIIVVRAWGTMSNTRDVLISLFKLSHICIIMYTYTSVYIYPYVDTFVFIYIMRCLPNSIYSIHSIYDSIHFTLVFMMCGLSIQFYRRKSVGNDAQHTRRQCQCTQFAYLTIVFTSKFT